jgi:hypothetical protein
MLFDDVSISVVRERVADAPRREPARPLIDVRVSVAPWLT